MVTVLPMKHARETSTLPAPSDPRAFRRPLSSTSRTWSFPHSTSTEPWRTVMAGPAPRGGSLQAPPSPYGHRFADESAPGNFALPAPIAQNFQRDQAKVFDHILSSCENAGGKILSIHSRRATTQVIGRLLAYPSAGVPILHWFSGSARELDRAIDGNCWFSVNALMLATKKGRSLSF